MTTFRPGKLDCAFGAIGEAVVRAVDALVMSSSVGAVDGNAMEEISTSTVADVEVLMSVDVLLYESDFILCVSSNITCKVYRTVSKTAVTALVLLFSR